MSHIKVVDLDSVKDNDDQRRLIELKGFQEDLESNRLIHSYLILTSLSSFELYRRKNESSGDFVSVITSKSCQQVINFL